MQVAPLLPGQGRWFHCSPEKTELPSLLGWSISHCVEWHFVLRLGGKLIVKDVELPFAMITRPPPASWWRWTSFKKQMGSQVWRHSSHFEEVTQRFWNNHLLLRCGGSAFSGSDNGLFFSLLTLKAALVSNGRKSLVAVANAPVTILYLITGQLCGGRIRMSLLSPKASALSFRMCFGKCKIP